ncbi:MAG: DUF4214 domain-containing protein [Gemmataceae bacterium]
MPRRAIKKPSLRRRLDLEFLEVRLTPATHVWIGGQGVGAAATAWSNSANWIGGAPDTTEVGAVLYFPSNAQGFASNDDVVFTTGSIGAVDFTGDITNGTGGNYTGANLLAAPSAATPNQNNYIVGVQGVVTALPFSGTTVTTGGNTQNDAPLVPGSGNATIGDLVQSTDTISGPVTFQATGAAIFNDSPGAGTTPNLLVVSGNITDSQPAIVGAVVVNSSTTFGVVEFDGTNTYGGGTTITAGDLLVTSNAALGNPVAAPGTVIDDGAELQLMGNLTIATGQPIEIGSHLGGFGNLVDISGNSSINDPIIFNDGQPPGESASEIDINNAGDTLTLNGVISSAHPGAGLFKSGPGTLLLPAATANTYDGSTRIFEGTVDMANALSLGSPTTARITIMDPGTVLKMTGNFTVGAGAAVSPAENFQLAGATIESISGNQTIDGSVTLTGFGTGTPSNLNVDTAAGALTVSGVIADGTGANDININAPGVAGAASAAPVGAVVFTNNGNTFSGTTNIDAGALQIQADGALGAAGTAAGSGTLVADGAVLQVNIGGGTIPEYITLGSAGLAPAALEQVDTGATVTNNYTGGMTLQSALAEIQVDRGPTDTAGSAASSNEDVANFSGIISGNSVTINQQSSMLPVAANPGGTVEYSGTASNIYTGTTTVLAGTLALSKAGGGVVAIPAGSSLVIGAPPVSGVGADVLALVIDGTQDNEIDPTATVAINPNGVLDLASFSQTLPSLTMVGGLITSAFGAGKLTLTGDVNATSGQFVDGGNTTIQTAEIDFTRISWAGTRTFNVSKGPALIDLELSNTASINDGASAAALTKAGAGRMRIVSSNDYTGLTTVSAGILEAASSHALGNNPDDATPGTSITVADNATLAIDASVTLGDGSKVLTLNGVGASGSALGTATSPNPGALEGVGNIDNSAATAAAYRGPIVLNGASQNTIGADKAISKALPLGSIGNSASGTVPFYDDNEAPDTAPTAAGAIAFPSVTLTLAGLVSGPGGLTTVGGGNVVMGANTAVLAVGAGGDNTYTGPTQVQWGTLELNQEQHVGANAPVASVAVPTALTIGGAGFPAKVDLDQSNEIDTAVAVAVNQKGTLDVQGELQTIGGGLSMTAGTLNDASDPASLNPGTDGSVTLAAGTVTATSAGGVTSIISVPNLILNGAETFDLSPGGAATDLIVTSVIEDGTTPGSVTETGGGTMKLTGANTFAGATSDDNGTLLLDGAAGVPTVPGALNISDASGDVALVRLLAANQTAAASTVNVLSANGTFDLNDLNDTIAALGMTGGVVALGFGAPSPAGTLTITAGPVTVNAAPSPAVIASGAGHVVDFNGSTVVFDILSAAGMIIGVPIQHGGLTKTGTGPLLLNGGGTYSGATTVNAGKLFVNGSQPGSSVTVDSGGTLGGTGTVGNVTVAANGTLAPGSSGGPGILSSTGSVNLQNGSNFNQLINGTTPGAGFSQLSSAGTVAINGTTLKVTINGAFPANTTFTIIQASSVLGTFGNLDLNGNVQTVNDGKMYVNIGANAVTLNTTAAVPDVVIDGTSGDDVLTVLRTAAGGVGSITYILNGGAPVSLTNVRSFTFNGLAGSDTMVVDFSNGEPLVPAGVSFDGGVGANTLTIDAAGLPVRTLPGGMTVGDPQTVSYANLQTTNVNNAATVNAIAGPDTADRGTALPGLTPNERFVQVLYLDALGRAGATSELDGWATLFGTAGQTQTQDQAAIAAGIEHSAEGRDHLAKSWYRGYLGRTAQNGEEQGWVNLLRAGQTEERVLGRILASAEFFQRAQTLGFGDTPNGNYVRALYLLLLDRSASSTEVAGWVAAVPSLGRQNVALAYLQSQEFRTDDFEGYFNALLHRPGDLAGLNSWVKSNLDVAAVRIGFESSGEFFANG